MRLGAIALLSAAAIRDYGHRGQTVSRAQLASAPWPMFHHDLAHTGLSPYDTSANPGLQKWKFPTSARFYRILASDRRRRHHLCRR